MTGYPCLWCGLYVCSAPLRRCSHCDLEYERMADGMVKDVGARHEAPLFKEKKVDDADDVE